MRHVLLTTLLLLPASALARVAPPSLSRLVRDSAIVARVKVTRIANKVAEAVVEEQLKGPARRDVQIALAETIACDMSSLTRAGERVLVFLEGTRDPTRYRLAAWGRGRLPLIGEGQGLLVDVSTIALGNAPRPKRIPYAQLLRRLRPLLPPRPASAR